MTVAAGLPNSRLIYISTHHCTGAPIDICFRSKYAGFVILITISSSYLFMAAGVVQCVLFFRFLSWVDQKSTIKLRVDVVLNSFVIQMYKQCCEMSVSFQ